MLEIGLNYFSGSPMEELPFAPTTGGGLRLRRWFLRDLLRWCGHDLAGLVHQTQPANVHAQRPQSRRKQVKERRRTEKV